jgi:type IV secretion system protein TrbJ
MCSTGYATPVEDFVTESNTWATYLKEVQSTINEMNMIQNQLTQLQYEEKNIQKMSGQQWDSAQTDLMQLSEAMNKEKALTYTMSNLDANFKQRYPGYNGNDNADYSTQYQSWVETNQATMNGVLDQMHTSYAQEQEENSVIQLLSGRAKSATGRMQALQVGNEIAAEQIAQLQKLKADIQAQSNAQAEYYAYQSQKDASEQQSVNEVVKKASDTFPTYQENNHFSLIPQFGNGE